MIEKFNLKSLENVLKQVFIYGKAVAINTVKINYEQNSNNILNRGKVNSLTVNCDMLVQDKISTSVDNMDLLLTDNEFKILSINGRENKNGTIELLNSKYRAALKEELNETKKLESVEILGL